MAEGADLPEDDQSIADDVWALRRVHPSQVHHGRPDSSVFKKDPDGLGTSVTLSLSPVDLQIIKAGYDPHGVVAVQVGAFRALGLGILYTFEEGNPNHCEVFGPRGKSAQKQLSTGAKWVVRPEGYDESAMPDTFDPQM